LLDRLEHRLAAGAAGDRIAQAPRQPLEHRSLQQEGADLGRLAVEHFLSQVVQHVPVAAAERGHEPGRIGVPSQRQRRELQSGSPSLGARRQHRHRLWGQVAAGGLAQQRCRLVCAEPQVTGTQLRQLPVGPQPGQRQRRVGTAGQHQVQARRQMLNQELNRAVHWRGFDQVIVIEDQQRLFVTRLTGEFVDQRRDQPLKRGWRGRAQQRPGPVTDSRPHPV
jgi:hypothetical protein